MAYAAVQLFLGVFQRKGDRNPVHQLIIPNSSKLAVPLALFDIGIAHRARTKTIGFRNSQDGTERSEFQESDQDRLRRRRGPLTVAEQAVVVLVRT